MSGKVGDLQPFYRIFHKMENAVDMTSKCVLSGFNWIIVYTVQPIGQMLISIPIHDLRSHLLNMILVGLAGLGVVICLMIVPAQGSNCNAGYHLVSGHCCKSINCPRDYQFHLCIYDGGYDTCTVCPSGEINPDEIDTEQWEDYFKVCHIPKCDCLPGAIITNYDQCLKTDEKLCECNREEWYYGEDPNNCILANATLKSQVMKEDMELLQNGTVRQCLPGFFKPLKNGSTCRPHSKCPEGFSMDVPGTSVSDTTCKISTPIQTYPRDSSLSTTSTPCPNCENAEEKGSGSGLTVNWIIVLCIVGPLLVVLVVFVGGCCAYLILLKRGSTNQNKNDKDVRTIEEDIGSSQTPLIEHQKSKDEQNNNPTTAKPNPTEEASETSEDAQNRGDTIKKAMESQDPCIVEQPTKKKSYPNTTTLHNRVFNSRTHDSLDDLLKSSLDFNSLLSDHQPETTMSSESGFHNIPVAQGDSFSMHGRHSTISRDQGIGHSEEFSKDYHRNATIQLKTVAAAQSPKES